MTINSNNKKVTDIFKPFFEPGSEDIVTPNLPANGNGHATVALEQFTGTLRIEDNNPMLYILGGGKFHVASGNGQINFTEYNDKAIVIRGLQQGDTIISKGITLQSQPPSSVRSNRTKNPQMQLLAGIVTEFAEVYKDKAAGLLTARPGYKFENGIITAQPAIVAVVERKIHKASLTQEDLLPSSYKGYPVDVVPASPIDILQYHPEVKTETNVINQLKAIQEPTFLEALTAPAQEAAILEAARLGNNYTPPPHVSLDEVQAAMTLTCHVSPEGGWTTLGPFLDDTQEHLQVAMYDFSAPQIYKMLKKVVRRGVSLTLVYDGNPAANVGKGTKVDDVAEDTIITALTKLGKQNFKSIKAWKGKSGICNNAYHIKVAVRDKKSFWLSSGNWQSSNQPDEDFASDNTLLKEYNREWNIIVDNTKLSDIYYKFIEWDFTRSAAKPEADLIESFELPDMYLPEETLEWSEIAKYRIFPPKKITFTRTRPVRIQPVLTPDNYIEHALSIIRSAKRTLYFQNQYISIGETLTPEYEELLNTLMDKINDPDIDARVILRAQRSDTDRKMLEALQAYGFDMSRVKMMSNTHTKGIIADGERILIGSHNYSNAGVQYNRDASLLIYNDVVANYYQDVFLHDWERRSRASVTEESVIIGSSNTEASLIDDGLSKISWKEYFSS
ncbi:MAG TPA: phospholipase D-like domain-containing protein [Ohtaekwangia sp.]|uniref:phospholipase D-like domain-containing protein n=1 Tax=Ohtaekwangia sp. TaxID=2066019 RepID=UPI002F943C5B